jgi:hypothetical protein
MDLVYLGVSGVLHPSESRYHLVHGRSPWLDGHSKYEGVSVLEQALARWPQVQLVLTSTQPKIRGLESVLALLGPSLAQRVVGHTYDDLTMKVKRMVRTRDGGAREVAIADDDYWRMDKAQIVAMHVQWFQPQRWVVIDDEDILWPQAVRDARLVRVDGCAGLLDATVHDTLLTVLEMNFGQVVIPDAAPVGHPGPRF